MYQNTSRLTGRQSSFNFLQEQEWESNVTSVGETYSKQINTDKAEQYQKTLQISSCLKTKSLQHF